MVQDQSADKRGRLAYGLTEAERRYLQTGETGGYSPGELDYKVQQKIDRLGDRVDRLLADVELLAKNGWLDEEHWQDSWTGFIGFEPSPTMPEGSRRPLKAHINNDTEPDA